MTANQIPYDAIDWLQIAIYFLALPLVALFGAAIGLLGRTRRGGMLWSTNVGLLGGAIVCVTYALALSTLVTGPSPGFFEFFEYSYRWATLLLATCATFACSLAAGIAWRRIHPPRELQPFAFSMQSFLLIQFFTLLSMGSFVGLRYFLLNETTDQVTREFRWSAPGWSLDSRRRSAEFSLQRLTSQEIQEGLSNATLKELASLSKIKIVSIEWDVKSNPDLSPLLESSTIESISISCKSMPNNLIEKLAVSNVKKLHLQSDFRAVDLAPLAEAKSLRTLTLGGRFTAKGVESLADSASLESLWLSAMLMPEGRPIVRWPLTLKELRVTGVGSFSRDCDALANHPNLETLEILAFQSPALDDQALAAIATLPKLRRAQFDIENITIAGYESLLKSNCEQLLLRFQDREVQTDDLQGLKHLKMLVSLDISWSSMADKVARELINFDTLTVLNIGSARVSEETILELAKLPNLRSFGVPSKLTLNPTQAKVDEKRKSLKLPRLLIDTLRRIPGESMPDRNEDGANRTEP